MLVDDILDAVASTRNSLRVAPFRNEADGKFLVTMLIELDPACTKSCATKLPKQERSPAKLVRRYIVAGFRDCLSDDMEQAA